MRITTKIIAWLWIGFAVMAMMNFVSGTIAAIRTDGGIEMILAFVGGAVASAAIIAGGLAMLAGSAIGWWVITVLTSTAALVSIFLIVIGPSLDYGDFLYVGKPVTVAGIVLLAVEILAFALLMLDRPIRWKIHISQK